MANQYAKQIFVSAPAYKGGPSFRYRFDGVKWVDTVHGKFCFWTDDVDGWPVGFGTRRRIEGHFEAAQDAPEPAILPPGTRVRINYGKKRGTVIGYERSSRYTWSVYIVRPDDGIGNPINMKVSIPEAGVHQGDTIYIAEVHPDRLEVLK